MGARPPVALLLAGLILVPAAGGAGPPERRVRDGVTASSWRLRPGTLGGMINATTPLFTVLMGALLIQSLPSRLQGAGLGLGFLGVVAISIPSVEGRSNLLGVALDSSFGLSSLLAVIALGTLGTGVAFVWFTAMIGRLGPARASVSI